ncbi:hypothetical protein ACWF94_38620 [Streptomyces sp. NPDC055078]
MSATLLAGIARTTEPQTMLRRILFLDALVTGANGVAYAVAPGPIGRLLGVDETLLLGLGLFLTGYGIAVGLLGARARPSVPGVKVVIDCNLVWVAASLVALALWLDPTTAGTVWVPLQALTVGGFAALQWACLRVVARA